MRHEGVTTALKIFAHESLRRSRRYRTFLLAAHDYIVKHNATLDKDQKKPLKLDALGGVDIVDGVVRLCAMNLPLHCIGPQEKSDDEPALREDEDAVDLGSPDEQTLQDKLIAAQRPR
jgi:hypothetical protein